MMGGAEALVIGAVIFLLFGAETLEELARRAGETRREVERAERELEEFKR